MEKYKPRCKFTEKEARLYALVEVPKGLEGLCSELLADLHDLVLSFGVFNPDEPEVMRLSFRQPKEISVTASSSPEVPCMIIYGPGGQTGAGTQMVYYRGGDFVIWDGRVRVEDIKRLILEIDCLMAKRGFIDPVTGERKKDFALVNFSPLKYRVDEVFQEPGAGMFVPPGEDAEKMRQEFDRPEEIMILEQNAFGVFPIQSLIHKRDEQYLRKRDTEVERILLEEGITSIEDIKALSVEQILELREKIDKRLKFSKIKKDPETGMTIH